MRVLPHCSIAPFSTSLIVPQSPSPFQPELSRIYNIRFSIELTATKEEDVSMSKPPARSLPCRRHSGRRAVPFEGVNYPMITYSHPRLSSAPVRIVPSDHDNPPGLGKTVAHLRASFFAFRRNLAAVPWMGIVGIREGMRVFLLNSGKAALTNADN